MKRPDRQLLTASLSHRVTAFILIVILTVSSCLPLTSIQAEAAAKQQWGIFIGVNLHGNTSRVKNYKNIVVDVQYYYPNEIKSLKSGGRKVYSYLSVGTLENYRPYYKRFKKYTFGVRENWPEEKWMDVSQKSWQDFFVDKLIASVRRKGCDGLWLDNTDVYEKYPRTAIYNGLVNILNRCKKKNIPVYINGGDRFVSKLISQGKARLIKGVAQEEVYTVIKGYSSNKFGIQSKSSRAYYEKYFKKVKKAGLSVTIVEYTKSAKVRKAIISYCKKKGYNYYIADSVELD